MKLNLPVRVSAIMNTMLYRKHGIWLSLVILWLVAFAPEAHAYIGPGAGFAFLGSTFVFVLTFLLGIVTIALWPLQLAWRKIRGFGVSRKARTRRVVIVGLDGLEPSLTERLMHDGRLPNLSALKDQGAYRRLGTTLPALSPVAWSTFQTGVNPGSHNIFDFLTRDKRSCLPELASTETVPGAKRSGLWRFLGKRAPQVRITRKSKPFWKILGSHGVFSSIIRVPISYPPEKFYGTILSAMCTPDLRGSQGTFSFFSSTNGGAAQATGGERHALAQDGNRWKGELCGPPREDGQGFHTIPFWVYQNGNPGGLTLEIGGKKHGLPVSQFSPWVEVDFPVSGRKKVSGICRVCVRKTLPELEIYFSPVNIHPDKPALPIAHPIYFSSWLAKKHGLFGTLGLMEDTWGRNELALDDASFLQQAYLTHAEREEMFFDALGKTREGVCACVFDASDRIQHMFWRYQDPKHPSPRENSEFERVIPEMYERMDALVGKVRSKLGPNDVLIVLSDHGFASFRRGINLNTWLLKEGYLTLKDGASEGADYFQNVDWSKTKAYAVGLTGMYINRAGRERLGIVSDEEFESLKKEIAAKLEAVRDPLDGNQPIRRVFDTLQCYHGLYAEEAPDLIMGYNPGYRVSWDSVTGGFESEIFSDNTKAWSGDHHVDPELIPGILFSNRPIRTDKPHIMDIAPTVLDLFAVKAPAYMEGQVII